MHFLDKGTRGKVLGLRVRCSKDGCDWEGELGDMERHLSNKCLYVEEVCPHGCGQSYPRHLLQIHQLGECPQRPQLESVERQLTQKYELLQQQLLECLEQQKKKHEELQQQLIHQEKKHDQDKKELQQQLAQQEKKQEEDKEELQEQLIQREEEVEELWEQLAQQEREHKEDKVKLQLQLSLIQQLTGTNNALTLHLVGSIGPCGVSAKISLVLRC